MKKNSFQLTGESDRALVSSSSNKTLDAKSRARSDIVVSYSEVKPLRKAYSVPILLSEISHNELCAPDKYLENPVWTPKLEVPTPVCCLWKYITQEDATYLRNHQRNKKIVLEFIEQKFVTQKLHNGNNDVVIVRLLWEAYKFARENWVSDRVFSAILGLVYLTHLFFLSHPWRTTQSVHDFFWKTVLLHAVLDLPESLEVFTITQCESLFEFFRTMYLENLPLLRIACHPDNHFSLTLCKIRPPDHRMESSEP